MKNVFDLVSLFVCRKGGWGCVDILHDTLPHMVKCESILLASRGRGSEVQQGSSLSYDTLVVEPGVSNSSWTV